MCRPQAAVCRSWAAVVAACTATARKQCLIGPDPLPVWLPGRFSVCYPSGAVLVLSSAAGSMNVSLARHTKMSRKNDRYFYLTANSDACSQPACDRSGDAGERLSGDQRRLCPHAVCRQPVSALGDGHLVDQRHLREASQRPSLEVVDIYERPALAKHDQILAGQRDGRPNHADSGMLQETRAGCLLADVRPN